MPSSTLPEIIPPPLTSISYPTRRFRGGQPGNSNALKHGFYTKKLPITDLKMINDHEFDGLKEEIDIQRLFIRRLTGLCSNPADVDQAARYLQVLSFAFTTLSRLIRADKLLFPTRDNSFTSVMGEILSAVNREQGVPPSQSSGGS